MNEPASHGDGRPLAANLEDQLPISPNKATEPTSVQNSGIMEQIDPIKGENLGLGLSHPVNRCGGGVASGTQYRSFPAHGSPD